MAKEKFWRLVVAGGGLSAFAAHGYDVYGVDIQQRAVEFAQNIFATKGLTGTFVCADIFDYTSVQKFDIIILHDAIEHIPNKESLMLKIRDLLSPGGIVYVAFPPWQMPFGGHQQVAKSKILSNIPYTHLLPRPIFWLIFRLFGESKSAIRYFFELRDTGISIERFEKLVNRTGYNVKDRQLWFINPNYQTKFGLKPRKQSGFITSTPWVRDFVTTTCYLFIVGQCGGA